MELRESQLRSASYGCGREWIDVRREVMLRGCPRPLSTSVLEADVVFQWPFLESSEKELVLRFGDDQSEHKNGYREYRLPQRICRWPPDRNRWAPLHEQEVKCLVSPLLTVIDSEVTRKTPKPLETRKGKQILLSVLVLSLPERLNTGLKPLLASLQSQVQNEEVELLVLIDNYRSSIGKKRNDARSLAQGEFIAYVDDDDHVEPDYVKELLDAIHKNPLTECIVFDVAVTGYTSYPQVCRYGRELQHRDTSSGYERFPNPRMAFRKSVAIKVDFPDVNSNEDDEWARSILPHYTRQTRISKVLYHYRFSLPHSRAGWALAKCQASATETDTGQHSVDEAQGKRERCDHVGAGCVRFTSS